MVSKPIIQVSRSSDSLFLSQQKYTTDLLKKFGFLQCSSVSKPISPQVETKSTSGTLLDSPTEYPQLVGALQYLSITRLDITFDVNLASQYMHAPTTTNFTAAKRILRYLSSTKSHGVTILASPYVTLRVYMDSDWTGCPVSRRSTSGYCIFFGDNLITWSSKKQYLLRDLDINLASPPVAYCDNIAATYLAYSPVMHSRTKHISIDCHFEREKVALGALKVVHVPTHAQLADAFIKALFGH
ncbi:transmembrane signal receptor [Lithospermum erythrorhizon]|uniref:Transmembrane signal receptor n=1 Tax=Lithospermum erythrorhizon TaxID=34254 RepID=A0AAV3NQ11_LITER